MLFSLNFLFLVSFVAVGFFGFGLIGEIFVRFDFFVLD